MENTIPKECYGPGPYGISGCISYAGMSMGYEDDDFTLYDSFIESIKFGWVESG
jgi:hypothetical protein